MVWVVIEWNVCFEELLRLLIWLLSQLSFELHYKAHRYVAPFFSFLHCHLICFKFFCHMYIFRCLLKVQRIYSLLCLFLSFCNQSSFLLTSAKFLSFDFWYLIYTFLFRNGDTLVMRIHSAIWEVGNFRAFSNSCKKSSCWNARTEDNNNCLKTVALKMLSSG